MGLSWPWSPSSVPPLFICARPDAFVHPQFWAEDGVSFFAPAYNHGGLGLLWSEHAGYLAILNRGVALVAVHLPLSWAPSLFNGTGLICQLLPALILVSRRSESLISAQWIRVGVALFYFALPGTFEVDLDLTNAQWHLAVAAALLLLAHPPRTNAGEVFDAVIVAVAGLTGPFAFVLLPIAVAVALIRRGSRSYTLAGLVLVTFVCQLICLINSPRSAPVSLGANLNVLSRLIGGRVALGPVLGGNGFVEAQRHVTSTAFWVACAIGGASSSWPCCGGPRPSFDSWSSSGACAWRPACCGRYPPDRTLGKDSWRPAALGISLYPPSPWSCW